ncbi:S-layer homology domain-containing protein [Priestia koreensis]|uniref:S-layer homology domain-containing protein n=1 Tax=Priestia koreensis TaxID=284581 RepID=UPI003458084F
MKKRVIAGILSVGLMFTGITNVSASSNQVENKQVQISNTYNFKDVPRSHWAYDSVQYLVNKGIISGYTKDIFKPNEKVTHAQVAIMMTRALKLDIYSGQDLYIKDVPKTHPSYRQINAVIKQFPALLINGKFNPNAAMKRDEMAYVIAQGFNLQAKSNVYFRDVSTGSWSYSFISAVVTNNISSGYNDNTFKPFESVTRAQFSVFTAKALRLAESGGNNGQTNPTPEQPGYGDEIIRGIRVGMNKQQVKSLETGTLIKEDATTLMYTGIEMYDLPTLGVTYDFDSKTGKLAHVFIGYDSISIDLDTAEGWFLHLYDNLSSKYGEADYLDTDWYDDYEDYVISALWKGNPDIYMQVKIDDIDYTTNASVLFTITVNN